jgi:hypothetical protein
MSKEQLNRVTAIGIAARYGLEDEVKATFKRLNKTYGKKYPEHILWSMALDEWELL